MANKDKKYNIDFKQRVADQNGACLICLRYTDRLCVDHDHRCCNGRTSCGECVRGLLCPKCNNALGLFNDNSEVLRRAIEYLDGYHDRLYRSKDSFLD